MRRDLMLEILSAAFILVFTTSLFAFAQPDVQLNQLDWDFPRLDELWMIRALSYEPMEMCRASSLDVNTRMTDPYNVNELHNLGWNISTNPDFQMCYFGVNCRNVTPETSGEYWDYHSRTPGFPLYPLNISQFRLALEYIVGCEKDAWIAEYYQFINIRLDTTIPPANTFWYNPYIAPYPEDWAKAEMLLLNAGFTWDLGGDTLPHTTDDIWYCPNGMKLIGGSNSTSPGSDRWAGDAYGIYVLTPNEGLCGCSPTYLISREHIRKWNLFFTGEEQDAALFIIEGTDDIYHLVYPPYYNRDSDMFLLCWDLRRSPDYLYNFFHPEVDLPGADNGPGLINNPLDQLLWTLKYWRLKDYEILDYNIGDFHAGKVLPAGSEYFWEYSILAPALVEDVKVQRCTEERGVYYEYLVAGVNYTSVGPNGIHVLQPITLMPGEALEVNFESCTYERFVTDVNEMRDYCWLIQWKLYYLAPYLPLYSRNYINAFKPGLTGWIESTGFGSCPADLEMPWTYCNIHWVGQPTGGSVNWRIGYVVYTMNPFEVSRHYEYMQLNRLFDSLYVVNPYTHENMPWVATSWEMVPWSSEDENVSNGMKLRVWLRSDVYWQDGDHVTAEDVKWNWDFINSTQAPKFAALIEPYLGCEVVNDYLLEVYINTTGLWTAYKYLENGLLFPRIVWEPFWGDYTAASTWDPWNILYEDWTGQTPVTSGLTCLYGTGPFVYDFWSEVDIAHLVKNQNYWVRQAGLPTAQIGALYTPSQCHKNVTGELLPKITKPFLDVLIQNLNIEAECELTWEIILDETTIIANGAQTLDQCGYYAERIMLDRWIDFPPCVHNWTLRIQTAEGESYYSIAMAWLIGDVDCNSKVDLIDIMIMILAYGSELGDLNWNENADINCDDRIDLQDIFTYGILNYGKECSS